MEAKLQVVLLTSRALLLQSSLYPLNGVRGLDSRVKADVGSYVRRERSVFPLTVVMLHGPAS